MRILAALMAAALLVGCMPSSNAITGRPWRLVQIDDTVPAADAGISFGVDGRVAVSPGCNSGGGTFAIEGNRISVGELMLTAMACGEPADSQEQAFLAVLGASPRFEIETRTGRLRLSAGDAVLVFETP